MSIFAIVDVDAIKLDKPDRVHTYQAYTRVIMIDGIRHDIYLLQERRIHSFLIYVIYF